MTETQETICAWAQETFGPAPSAARIAARANEEMAELMVALVAREKGLDDMVVEAADVAIVLFRLAKLYGCEVNGIVFTPHRRRDPRGVEGEMSPAELAVIANKHMARLLRAITAAEAEADVQDKIVVLLGWLSSMCAACGQQLGEAVVAKMAINRARQWRLDGTGHGYHVRPGGEADAGREARS